MAEFKWYNNSSLNFIVSQEGKGEGQRGRGRRKIWDRQVFCPYILATEISKSDVCHNKWYVTSILSNLNTEEQENFSLISLWRVPYLEMCTCFWHNTWEGQIMDIYTWERLKCRKPMNLQANWQIISQLIFQLYKCEDLVLK